MFSRPSGVPDGLKVTVDAAGERYSPELHVDLPVAFALEGTRAVRGVLAAVRRSPGSPCSQPPDRSQSRITPALA